jgi:anti-sigma regulatory factor (Ser/Thr protein kinase)
MGRYKSLEEGMAAIERFCEEKGLEEARCYKLRLVCEELVVNLLTHGGGDGYELRLAREGETVSMGLRYGGEKFNPGASDKGPLESIEESEFGGLGLFLVTQLVTSLHYRYENGENVVDITI